MKTLVLDTNVLVSAFLSPHGTPARLLEALFDEKFRIAWDNRIRAEYIEVLSRPKFKIPKNEIAFIEIALKLQENVRPVYLKDKIPDEDDKPFVEVALATEDKTIITGNTKHYPIALMRKLGVSIKSPADILPSLEL